MQGMTPSAHKRHQMERQRREREALGEIDRRGPPRWLIEPPRRVCRHLGNLAREAWHKAKPVEGEHQLFGFLTTDANDVVGAIHPKAMPVILTTPAEIDQWMTAPAEEALKLQRPLPDGMLKIVMTGEKEDG